MKPDFLLQAGLLCIGIDMLFRLLTLGYWLFSPHSTPDLPFLYKGIRYPEIQIPALLADVLVVVAACHPAWRTPRRYRLFSLACIGAAVLTLLASALYSGNVAGSAAGFALAAGGFAQLRKSWQPV